MRQRLISRGADPVNLGRLRTATGAALLVLFVNPDGKLCWRNAVTATNTCSTLAITTGVWRRIDVHLKPAATSGLVEVWVNGAKIAALSQTANFGSAAIGMLDLGEQTPGRSFDQAFDDVGLDSQPPA